MILVGIQRRGPEHPAPLDAERVEEILGGAPTESGGRYDAAAHYVGVALRQAMGGVLFTDLLDFDADLNDAGRSPFGSIAAHEWCRAEVRRPPTSRARSPTSLTNADQWSRHSSRWGACPTITTWEEKLR